MERHPDARPAPRGRETLISRVRSGVPVSEAARQMGVSRQMIMSTYFYPTASPLITQPRYRS